MNKCESPIGEKYGRLTVESYYGVDVKTRNRLWNCRCECNNVIIRRLSALRSGNTKSCGCLHKEHNSGIGMRNHKDLTGKKIGRLLVLEKTEKNSDRRFVYKCLCDCGKYKNLNSNELRIVRSCGCLHSETSRNKTFKDLTGKRFGRLTVIKERRDIPKKTTDALWECQCDCGKNGIWTTHTLNSGNTTSCGCFVEQMSRMKMQDDKFQSYCRMMNQLNCMENSGLVNIL